MFPNTKLTERLDIFTYTINFTLPSENGSDRTVSVGNGTLVSVEAPQSSCKLLRLRVSFLSMHFILYLDAE